MAFQSITTTEIQNGSTIDVSLLTKIKNNDDSLKLTNDTQDATETALQTQVTSLLSLIIPIGSLVPFAGSSSPSSSFLMAQGQAVSRVTYASLFAIIGTTYGSGDGSTTFNLPDTRAAFIRGVGTSTKFTQNHTTSLGTYENDAFQGHVHGITRHQSALGTSSLMPSASAVTNSGVTYTDSIANDGTHGEPRTANETRPVSIGLNYLIRVL